MLSREQFELVEGEDNVGAIHALRNRCFSLICNFEFESAKEVACRLLSDSIRLGETKLAGVAHMYLGLISLELGDTASASISFDRAIQISTEIGDIDLMYRIQGNLAYGQMIFEKYQSAIETLKQSLRQFEGEFREADNATPLYYIAFCRVQIALRAKLRDNVSQDQIDQAVHDLEVAEREAIGHSHLLTMLEIVKALLAGVTSGYQTGLQMLELVKPKLSNEIKAQAVSYHRSKSQLLELGKEWEAMVQVGERLLSEMHGSGWKPWYKSTLRRLSDAYAHVGRYEEAYRYLSMYVSVEKSEESQGDEVSVLKFEFDDRKFEHDVLRLRNRALVERNKMLEQEARFDPMSGLLNRRGTEEALEHYSKRLFADKFLIALVDIDHFKSINDIYGHAIGDQVIKEFASCLSSSTTNPAKIGRWGGEEFLIVFDVFEDQEPMRLGETLVNEIRRYSWDHIHSKMKVTASIGLALWHPGESVGSTVKLADERMYLVKTSGRDNWRAN